MYCSRLYNVHWHYDIDDTVNLSFAIVMQLILKPDTRAMTCQNGALPLGLPLKKT